MTITVHQQEVLDRAFSKAVDAEGTRDEAKLLTYAVDLETRFLAGQAYDPDMDNPYCWCGQSKFHNSRYCGPVRCNEELEEEEEMGCDLVGCSYSGVSVHCGEGAFRCPDHAYRS